MLRSLLMLFVATLTGIPSGICVCGTVTPAAEVSTTVQPAKTQSTCCHKDCTKDELTTSHDSEHVPGCPADDARITDLTAPPASVTVNLTFSLSLIPFELTIPNPIPTNLDVSQNRLFAPPPPFLTFCVLLI
jgi:hypothetical protein